MLNLQVYEPEYYKSWQNFIANSINGTIFHRLDFLAYHGDKFKKNEHHLMWLKGEEIVACLPLGIFKENGKLIAKSPFGASWGGLVYPEKFKLKYVLEIVETLRAYLKRHQVNECQITTTPTCYFREFSNYFEFALSSFGYRLTNREVMNVVVLPKKENGIWQVIDRGCRKQAKKAQKNFIIKEGTAEEFYPILVEDRNRHQVKPTHTLKDLQYLEKNLRPYIRIDVAQNSQGDKAGACYFTGNKKGIMTFYLAQENKAIGKSGINTLVVYGMQQAVKEGFQYFDFGTSSFNNKIANMGLVEFKESFGAIGISRDTYKLKL